LECGHGSLKNECIRPSCPATREQAQKRIAKYATYDKADRLHSTIGYITPPDFLAGLSEVIGIKRNGELEVDRKLRQ
jgi:hypothetical protein